MKYITAEVLAGSRAKDAEVKEELESRIMQLEDQRAFLIGEWQNEQKHVEETCAELLMRLQDGEEVTTEELQFAFVRPTKPHQYNPGFYGLDKKEVDRIGKQIEKAQRHLDEWEPSHLTQFLETVVEEFVTDYGVRTAGFSGLALGRLVLAGRRAAA